MSSVRFEYNDQFVNLWELGLHQKTEDNEASPLRVKEKHFLVIDNENEITSFWLICRIITYCNIIQLVIY